MYHVLGTRKGNDGKEGIFNLVGGYPTKDQAIQAALNFLRGYVTQQHRYFSLVIINISGNCYLEQLEFVPEIKTEAQLKIVRR